MTAPGAVKKRLALLVVALTLACAGYVMLLVDSPGLDIPRERTLGGPLSEPGVSIYLEVLGVDAYRNAMQVRVSAEPSGKATGVRAALLDHELVVALEHDGRAERLEIHPHQPAASLTVELDLYGGDVSGYPFDAYRAGLTVQCVEASPSAAAAGLPVSLTIWERVFGFRLRTSRDLDGSAGKERLGFQVHRSGAFIFFAVAVYGAMTALAGVALSIGTLAFLRVRRAEPTLVGALGAVVFALPALRNGLPGAPPLGVVTDLLVYLWAELAAVLALVLLVTTWARTGPRP